MTVVVGEIGDVSTVVVGDANTDVVVVVGCVGTGTRVVGFAGDVAISVGELSALVKP